MNLPHYVPLESREFVAVAVPMSLAHRILNLLPDGPEKADLLYASDAKPKRLCRKGLHLMVETNVYREQGRVRCRACALETRNASATRRRAAERRAMGD